MEISEIFTEETSVTRESGSIFKMKCFLNKKMLIEFFYGINSFSMMIFGQKLQIKH